MVWMEHGLQISLKRFALWMEAKMAAWVFGSPYVRESTKVLDSGFRILLHGAILAEPFLGITT